MNTVVRAIDDADRDRWQALYTQYRRFYEFDEGDDDRAVATVWGWLRDEHHSVHGIVAERDGAVVAFAHYREFARPSSGTVGVWLDDLFTAPEVRGSGAGRELIAFITERADLDQRSVVRWITAADNAVARRLYDGVATATNWVIYDAKPGQLPGR